jgi:transporter family-2 protein
MNRSVVFGTAAALLGGVAVTVQAAMLVQVGRSTGALRAGLLTYLAGGAVAGVLLLALRAGPAAADPPHRALWIIGAGVLGLAILTAIAYSTGRVTVAAGLATMLVGQMAAAVIVDALGVTGAAVAIDLRRIAGLCVMAVGAYLLLPR